MAFPLAALLGAIPTILGAIRGGKGQPWYSTALNILSKFLEGDLSKKSPKEIELELLKIDADKFMELKRQEHEFRKLVVGGEYELDKLSEQLAQEQARINAEALKSNRRFESSWRPLIGWISALGVGLIVLVQFFIFPLLSIVGLFVDIDMVKLQEVMKIVKTVDISFLLTILLPMLGIAGYRSVEKMNRGKTNAEVAIEAIKKLENK